MQEDDLASVDYMLSSLRPRLQKGLAVKERAGRNIIRGRSGRGYDFEALPVDVAAELDDVACVYIFARNISADTMHKLGEDATAKDFSLGFAGDTDSLAAAAANHQAAGHFRGFSFDTVLIARIPQAHIRAEVMEDVIALHSPVINDLLGGRERGLRS
jgi:hypothetical protein